MKCREAAWLDRDLVASWTGQYCKEPVQAHAPWRAPNHAVQAELTQMATQADPECYAMANGSGCGSDDPLARMRCSARLAGGSRALADATAALAGRDGGCGATAADAGALTWPMAAAEAGRAGRDATEEHAEETVDSEADTRPISS